MEFEAVAAVVEGVPFLAPDRGRALYDHVRSTHPATVLELGTAHGVSTCYIAAALEANGDGHLMSVDSSEAGWADPTPAELLARAGLADRVTLDRRHGSYNWFLKEQIEERSDAAGNCEPIYDFCFLDGGKNWTVEGFAVVLAEKLLRPGGWLAMDDLDWSYAYFPKRQHYWVPLEGLTREELDQPQLRAVFDLIVRQHPSFTEFRIENESWGWARKAPGEQRRLTLETTRPLKSILYGEWLRVRERLRRPLH